jgi:RNA-directed DNA polymerase
VDRRLARAKAVTRRGQYTDLEDARVADDLVLLVATYPPQDWLLKAVDKRRREERATLQVERKEEKSRRVALAKGKRFGCLGVDFCRGRRLQGQWRPHETPKLKQRTALLRQRKDIVRRLQSHPVDRVVQRMDPILRGWVNSCAIGASSRGFSDVRDGVEKQVRRHRRRARNLRGFGCKRWRRRRYDGLGRCNGSRVRRLSPSPTALPAREVSSPLA